MKKAWKCKSVPAKDSIEIVMNGHEDTLFIVHENGVRCSIILSDKDAAELSNYIKEYLTNKLLEIT